MDSDASDLTTSDGSSQHTRSPRRPANLAEARALAHPLRLRILRLCLDTARTNKELADLLGQKAGSLHHHVRTLVDTGFLVATDVRRGAGGALEKPYAATRKSWTMDTAGHHDEQTNLQLAMLDAFRDELIDAGSEARADIGRVAVTLDEAGAHELLERLNALLIELAERPPDAGGRAYSVMIAVHRQPARDPRSAPSDRAQASGNG